MVISRILFLSTYDTTLDYEELIKSHSLGDNINYVGSFALEEIPCTDKHSKSSDMQSSFPNLAKSRCHKLMNWRSLIL